MNSSEVKFNTRFPLDPEASELCPRVRRVLGNQVSNNHCYFFLTYQSPALDHSKLNCLTVLLSHLLHHLFVEIIAPRLMDFLGFTELYVIR